MKPTQRSPEMQKFLDEFSKKSFGRSHTEAIESSICVFCGEPAKDFRDEVSAREYQISAMCQACQDKTFVKGEPK